MSWTKCLTAVFLSLVALVCAAQARAGTVALGADTLMYAAAPGEINDLKIVGPLSGGGIVQVIDLSAPVTAGAGCSAVDANEAACPIATSLMNVHVILGDMDDSVSVRGGFCLNVLLEGGDGADVLQGAPCAENFLDGGAGPDRFKQSSTVDNNSDIVDYSSRTNPVFVTVGDGRANDGEAGEGDLVSGRMDVLGGTAGDTLYIISPRTVFPTLRGNDGDDKLVVRGGFKGHLDLGAELFGGAGDDTLVNAGRKIGGSIFFGQLGNDVLEGGAGPDVMWGGPGDDFLFGGRGFDQLAGGEDNDYLVGGRGFDIIRGTTGDDVLQARDGRRDRVAGGAGFDRARIDVGVDRLFAVESTL